MLPTNINKEDFFRSKYEFYSKLSFWVVVVASLISTTYFVSDCQLFGHFQLVTFIPRFFVILPMCIYIYMFRRIKNYKILVIASYIVLHTVMWDTIWAIYHLPDRSHAVEGFIIMHLMFFAIGFGAPFSYSTFFHVLLIADILISYRFNHYERLDLMLSLGIPCVVAVCAVQYMMQKMYVTHYHAMQKLEHQSIYDSLTDTFNRNYIYELTDEEDLYLRDSSDMSICLLMFDIDHFKEVNDTYGHPKGDIVLKELVKLINSKIRGTDHLIRWGGEEFVLFMYGCSISRAKLKAEQLRAEAEKMDNGVCPITISVGVARYDGLDYKSTIERADQALYYAKEHGRNQICLYNDIC